MKIHAPESHPRYLSNYYRDLLSDGVEKGITSLQGLTAHGRGEAFDYLLGEITCDFAHTSIVAAAALLLLAKRPIICTNGNTAILTPRDLIMLSKQLNSSIEINLFHQSKKREYKIVEHFQSFGPVNILLPDDTKIEKIESNRKLISKYGQKQADIIFVPLEDGDRTQALIQQDKKVITVDLNPLSRTAQNATITIVDNIVRALPILSKKIDELKNKKPSELTKIIDMYDNKKILYEALIHINKRLSTLSKKI